MVVGALRVASGWRRDLGHASEIVVCVSVIVVCAGCDATARICWETWLTSPAPLQLNVVIAPMGSVSCVRHEVVALFV